jgi:ankyrin repeat protein
MRLSISHAKKTEKAKMTQTLVDAVAQNDINAAKMLLKQNANVNKKADAGAGAYEGFTPLMIAAALGDPPMVDLLLNNGADVFIMDSRMGTTALHKAAQNGNVTVAELLLEKKAFIDAQAPTLGNTPLLDAVWHKHPAMVKCLLENGARTELTTRSGGKPIDIAKSDNNREIIDLLTEYEALRALRIARQKLMSAVEGNDLHRVENLIHQQVDVNEKAPLVGRRFDGYTPLLVAAFLGHDGIVQRLLKAGANPLLVDDQIKATAGHKAAYHGRTAAAEILVKDRHLDLDAQGPYNGYTALHDAIWHCHKQTTKVFLDAGARLDLRTHSGDTPLELAKFYCRCCPEIERLIRNKMDEADTAPKE